MNLILDKIDKEIKRLTKQMENVKGTPCEVYSRVVGYNRDVNFWNKGKRSEFKDRRTFIEPAPKMWDSKGDSYYFFWKEGCVNCGPVKKWLNANRKLNGIYWNIDEPVGREVALKYNVMSVPTVLIRRGNDIILRAFNVSDLEDFFKE